MVVVNRHIDIVTVLFERSVVFLIVGYFFNNRGFVVDIKIKAEGVSYV